MKDYEVVIDLNSLSYIVTAANEDEAIEAAYENATQESRYDILKRADYHVQEVK